MCLTQALSLEDGTHTGFLLQVLEGPRGRDEEVSEAAQPIAPVEPLSHAEHLPEHRGRRGLKWWVEVRECVLDVGVEGFQILKRRRGSRVILCNGEGIGESSAQRESLLGTTCLPCALSLSSSTKEVPTAALGRLETSASEGGPK